MPKYWYNIEHNLPNIKKKKVLSVMWILKKEKNYNFY